MLKQNAESFYWIGRYIERIDYTTRLMDVKLHAHHVLIEKENSKQYLQKRLLELLDGVNPIMDKQMEGMQEKDILAYITFNRNYENSIVSCLERTRHNVRTVREQLPSKVWDTINSFYLWLTVQKDQFGSSYLPFSFFEQIRNHVSLFLGVTESVMLRDHAWSFFQAGRFIERSGNTIRTLQLISNLLIEERKVGHLTDDYHRLLSILESVDGVEAFRRCHADHVTIEKITEFLVVNKHFPRSVLFSLNSLEMFLKMIQSDLQLEGLLKLNRLLAGIKVNFLAHDNFEDLTMNQLQSLLNELLINCEQIGGEIGSCFFYDNGGEFEESTSPRKVAAV
jgi:uncharacterized alpha-E superfamily protein